MDLNSFIYSFRIIFISMALLEVPVSMGKCPKCGSKDVEIEFRKFLSSKSSTITKKYIKCNNCGYES